MAFSLFDGLQLLILFVSQGLLFLLFFLFSLFVLSHLRLFNVPPFFELNRVFNRDELLLPFKFFKLLFCPNFIVMVKLLYFLIFLVNCVEIIIRLLKFWLKITYSTIILVKNWVFITIENIKQATLLMFVSGTNFVNLKNCSV